MKRIFSLLLFAVHYLVFAQDTFSIVAVDPVTGEVGSAGASCLDISWYPSSFYLSNADFLSVLIPGRGAINTQAMYDAGNQNNATARMLAGYSPQEIINWLMANDTNNLPQNRQYGIVDLNNGTARSKAFTGNSCLDYKGHIEGPTYAIQGNILLGKKVLDSMEARFNREQGGLACKLMAALQGAKMVGADTRCANNGTSALFAFLKVSKSTDPTGSPSILLRVKTSSTAGQEPIDLLQTEFNNNVGACGTLGTDTVSKEKDRVEVYPNPFSSYVQVVYHNEGTPYSIKDVSGNIIRTGKLQKGISRIDLQNLTAGLYFLIIHDGKTDIMKKIIRK